MGDQYGGGSVAGFNSGLKGEKIAGAEGFNGPFVYGNSGVGVGVVSVAWEVFHDGAHADLCAVAAPYHSCHIVRCRGGVLAKGAVINEAVWVGGDIAHGSEVNVDAETQQIVVFLKTIPGEDIVLCGLVLVQPLRGFAAFLKEVGVPAGPDYNAPLLVGANQHGDGGSVLTGLDGLCHLFRSEPVAQGVFEILREEKISPQVIFRRQFRGIDGGTADKEKLSRLFLHRHSGQQVINGFLSGVGFRLRDYHRREGGLVLFCRRGGGRCACVLHRTGGTSRQQQSREQEYKISFHIASSHRKAAPPEKGGVVLFILRCG